MHILELYGLGDYVSYDARVIRGLDYYTGLVFEAKDLGKQQRAILGGGHYANLVADVGGDPLPGVGFAMGDVVLPLVLERYGLLPQMNTQPMDVLVTVFNDELVNQSIQLAAELRRANIRAVNYPEIVKLEKQLKYADKIGLRWVIILGPDEIANGNVILKDMKNGTQGEVSRTKVVLRMNELIQTVSQPMI